MAAFADNVLPVVSQFLQMAAFADNVLPVVSTTLLMAAFADKCYHCCPQPSVKNWGNTGSKIVSANAAICKVGDTTGCTLSANAAV